ncbi:isocitrate lyase/PEP mutase family protein [Pelagovum pacificum]|uniref:Isocitrate lyase/phosphoenolpyruvate mutase family protein n=1 Tax=Pelagovum pacificum TaxID=2588711 RepID=A0A5C5GBB5_9RHOB|nr:isocitrate lyase/phosphoenolpyruvate mutase family protein [Pelagovum pacificum]TNY32092.1 isocitrate lyase/phosphoenolpyruvate mutase family protein [Pelagovum pacificum]
MANDPGATFRALHRKGAPFVMANVWDAGTARLLESLGIQALATSSAAHAYTLGRTDGGTLTLQEALDHAALIAASVALPVQGDFENGFAKEPEAMADVVRLAAEAGLAGICIEDTDLPGSEAYPRDLAAERIRAAVDAARGLDRDFVLTARADGVLRGSYGVQEAIKRLKLFEAAGADCLYVPMPGTMDDLRLICDSVTAPVNALVAGHFTTQSMEDFADAGVARLSLGSALARAFQRSAMDIATDMLERGRFVSLGRAASGSEVDALIERKDQVVIPDVMAEPDVSPASPDEPAETIEEPTQVPAPATTPPDPDTKESDGSA